MARLVGELEELASWKIQLADRVSRGAERTGLLEKFDKRFTSRRERERVRVCVCVRERERERERPVRSMRCVPREPVLLLCAIMTRGGAAS